MTYYLVSGFVSGAIGALVGFGLGYLFGRYTYRGKLRKQLYDIREVVFDAEQDRKISDGEHKQIRDKLVDLDKTMGE